MIRLLDCLLSLIGLIILLPFMLLIGLMVKISSKGPVLFVQQRVGRHNKDFAFYKFRTMTVSNNEQLQITAGANISRITKVGAFLRTYKLDELPQLFNVLINDMSFVGPRPEVRRYVNLYTPEQQKVLAIKPGITDYASLAFYNEQALLATQSNPEAYYINTIMPKKIQLNMQYVRHPTPGNYCRVLYLTIRAFFGMRSKNK